MDQIALPPRSLMNMLCEAYKSDEPFATLQNLLQPYCITYEQVQSVMGDVFWPSQMSAKENHPFYVAAQKMTQYRNEMDTTAKSNYFKKRFVYVATAVCHAWYTRQRKHDQKYMLHRDPHFVAYQYPGGPVPYAWLSFDKFGMPHVFAVSPPTVLPMPPLEIRLFRSSSVGDMLPLTVKFFEYVPPAPQGAGGMTIQSPSHLEFHIHNQQFIQLYTAPSNTRTYILFISEDLLLTRAIMVSPTTDNAWLIPVAMHRYE